MVGPWQVQERCPHVPVVGTEAVPPAPPPATTPAFCSPGLMQGAGVSRSARPSRCRSNHALITARGKFTV